MNHVLGETKIDRLEDRLSNIEELLKRISGVADAPIQSSLASGPNSISQSITTPQSAGARTSSPIAPSASLATDYKLHDATTGMHSTVAHKFIEQAVGHSPATYHNAELAAALRSLKEMVNKVEDTPATTDEVQSLWSRPGAEAVEPPSQAEIEKLLSLAQGTMTMNFSPGLTLKVLKEKCDNVFNNTQQPSEIRRVYVYGLLWSLCTEYSGLQSDPTFAKRCQDLAQWFCRVSQQAVGELKLVMPATQEAAAALAMAAGWATELCKPYLALSLSSTAASMVISLGYHRFSNMAADLEHEQQIRLGHAPVIRDYDITVPLLSYGKGIPRPFVDAFNFWTLISRLQCQAVEQLYSPMALRQHASERSRRATSLARDLSDAWEGRERAFVEAREETENALMFYLWKESDAVFHQSTLSLVHHATISTQDKESPALDSARKALRLNVEARKKYHHLPDFVWSGHCHWTLLKAPITPFIVVFCHIIAHPFETSEDLQLLAEFVVTLYELRRFSDGMVKMYKLCDVFSKVANLYVRAKTSESSNEAELNAGTITDSASSNWIGQPAVDDIDEYLSAIGFAPPPAPAINELSADMTGDMPFDASYLADWYAGNSSLMGLLEQDIGYSLNSGEWPGPTA